MRSPRDSYHHGDLANALTVAASQLARDGGPEAVVLREAARKVGVSATAAYRHFAGHGDLMHAVKHHAADQLALALRAELARSEALPDAGAEALRQMRALGRGYVKFALAEPGLFRTAFCHDDKGIQLPTDHDMTESAAYQMLSETLDTLLQAGLLPPERRPFAEIFAWSSSHGLATLIVDGPLSTIPADGVDAVIDRVLDGVIDGLVRP